MKWEFIHEHYEELLRYAPYVDLDAFRTSLIEACKDAAKDVALGDDEISAIESYERFKRATLPLTFKRTLHFLFQHQFPISNYNRRPEAIRCLEKYFFYSNYWMKCED